MSEQVADIGKITQSMCESVRHFLEMLPRACSEMRGVSLVTLGPFMHFDAWSPMWSERSAECMEGIFKFETTLGFVGRAHFFPEYPPPQELSRRGLLSGALTLDLRQHEASGFPGRYYEAVCTWVPHLQTHVFDITFAGPIPPVR